MNDKLNAITTAVKQEVVGRDSVVDSAMQALLAGEHCMLIGPPGNAKTMMFDRILDRIDGAKTFKTLLTPFTQPDEVLGPIMLSELKKDNVKRATEGFLPWADFALLDEIWKMNGPLGANLLSVLNERRFFDGNTMQQIPLRSMVCASNEMPYGAEFDAVIDRIAVRHLVPAPDSNDTQLFARILDAKLTDDASITVKQWDAASKKVRSLPLGESFEDFVVNELRQTLDKCAERLSSSVSIRRIKSGINVARARAYLRGASEVEREDALVFAHVCWNEPHQVDSVSQVIREIVGVNTQTIDGNTLDSELKEIVNAHQAAMIEAANIGDYNSGAAAIENKTNALKGKLDDIEKDWHRRLRNDPEYDVKISQFSIASQMIARQAAAAVDGLS